MADDLPDTLTFEDAHGVPHSSEAPDELTFEQAHGAPAGQAGQPTGWRETTADFLRGARATAPLAKDISAATRAYVGNPLTLTAPSGDFDAEKRAVEEQQNTAWDRSPVAYGAGAVAGVLTPGGPLSKLNRALPAAERLIAEKAAPAVGQTIARTAGAALPVTAVGAALGAGEGVTADERLTNSAIGAALGGAGGLAGDVLAPVIGAGGRLADKAVSALPRPSTGATGLPARAGAIADAVRGGNPFTTLVPDAARREAVRLGLPEGEIAADDLKRAAQAAYDRADKHNIILRPAGLRQLYADVAADLGEQGYHPKNTPELHAALEELKAAGQGSTPTTLKGLEVINRIANAATGSQNAQSRLHGGAFKAQLNRFLDNLDESHVLGGDTKAAVGALRDARELWRRKSKTEDLQNLLEDARNETASTGSGGNINNKLRQKITGLIKQARRNPARWSKDEIAAMRDVIDQGPVKNAARLFGKLSPGGNGLIATLELGALLSHSGHGPEMIATAIGSHAAKHWADAATHARVEDLLELVKRGGKRTAMSRSSVADEAKARALLGLTGSQIGTPALADREHRASGGAVKRLAGVEKALRVAQKAISEDTKPIMSQPDETVANALRLASGQ